MEETIGSDLLWKFLDNGVDHGYCSSSARKYWTWNEQGEFFLHQSGSKSSDIDESAEPSDVCPWLLQLRLRRKAELFFNELNLFETRISPSGLVKEGCVALTADEEECFIRNAYMWSDSPAYTPSPSSLRCGNTKNLVFC
jgi:hypothetical protein